MRLQHFVRERPVRCFGGGWLRHRAPRSVESAAGGYCPVVGRALTVTPLAIVIDVRARMVPTKLEPDPSVAELVTCQKTLHGFAPLMSTTLLEDAVTRSDVAWKTQTEFGSFWPSSVSVSVRSSVAPPAV